jgi:nitrogen fixation-related uncharacterized protein
MSDNFKKALIAIIIVTVILAPFVWAVIREFFLRK